MPLNRARRFYLIKKIMCKNILLLMVTVHTDGYERFEYQSLIVARRSTKYKGRPPDSVWACMLFDCDWIRVMLFHGFAFRFYFLSPFIHLKLFHFYCFAKETKWIVCKSFVLCRCDSKTQSYPTLTVLLKYSAATNVRVSWWRKFGTQGLKARPQQCQIYPNPIT